jgi:hypothetical protein
MKRTLVLIAIFACAGSFAAAADKQLLGLMMPDAKVLAGVNVLQVRNSPYGQYALSQFPVGDPHFQEFLQATGFDPTRDLTEIVAATADVQGGHKGLVAVRGNFDIAHIVSFVQKMGGTVDQSVGVTVLPSPDGQMGIALLDNTLAVVGDLNSVVGAVARRSTPTTLDPGLSARAELLSASNDAWVVSILAVPALPAGPGPAGLNLTALQSIQQASAGVKFGTSINVNAAAVADTAQNANALADVVRLLVGLAQMNQSDAKGAQFVALLKTMSIQTKGTSLEIGLAIPEELFEQLGPQMHPGVRHRRVAATVK